MLTLSALTCSSTSGSHRPKIHSSSSSTGRALPVGCTPTSSSSSANTSASPAPPLPPPPPVPPHTSSSSPSVAPTDGAGSQSCQRRLSPSSPLLSRESPPLIDATGGTTESLEQTLHEPGCQPLNLGDSLGAEETDNPSSSASLSSLNFMAPTFVPSSFFGASQLARTHPRAQRDSNHHAYHHPHHNETPGYPPGPIPSVVNHSPYASPYNQLGQGSVSPSLLLLHQHHAHSTLSHLHFHASHHHAHVFAPAPHLSLNPGSGLPHAVPIFSTSLLSSPRATSPALPLLPTPAGPPSPSFADSESAALSVGAGLSGTGILGHHPFPCADAAAGSSGSLVSHDYPVLNSTERREREEEGEGGEAKDDEEVGEGEGLAPAVPEARGADAQMTISATGVISKPRSEREREGEGDSELCEKLRKQMEYYLGDENLPRDSYLLGWMGKQASGEIPLFVFAGFKKIVSHFSKETATQTIVKTLKRALAPSTKLTVRKKSVHRTNPLHQEGDEWAIRKRNVLVDNLPVDHSIEALNSLFERVGKVRSIHLCPPLDAASLANGVSSKNPYLSAMEKHDKNRYASKLHAVVEYETAEAAERAVSELNDDSDWRRGLRVHSLLSKAKKAPTKTHETHPEKTQEKSVLVHKQHQVVPTSLSPPPPLLKMEGEREGANEWANKVFTKEARRRRGRRSFEGERKLGEEERGEGGEGMDGEGQQQGSPCCSSHSSPSTSPPPRSLPSIDGEKGDENEAAGFQKVCPRRAHPQHQETPLSSSPSAKDKSSSQPKKAQKKNKSKNNKRNKQQQGEDDATREGGSVGGPHSALTHASSSPSFSPRPSSSPMRAKSLWAHSHPHQHSASLSPSHPHSHGSGTPPKHSSHHSHLHGPAAGSSPSSSSQLHSPSPSGLSGGHAHNSQHGCIGQQSQHLGCGGGEGICGSSPSNRHGHRNPCCFTSSPSLPLAQHHHPIGAHSHSDHHQSYSPLLPNPLLGEALHGSASRPPPGPRMPDGTRGFAMGRGRPMMAT